jgi:TPR repeat protein
MALATAICLGTPAFSKAANSNEQDAEVQFGIQLTAALNNDPQAQFLVAGMYEQGVGTPQNLRMAHLWYTKSAKQGYAPAVEKLDNWEKARQESESLVRERAEQQKRRQAEAEAAAAAKAAREEAAKTTKASEPPPAAKDSQSVQPKDKPKETTAKSAEKSSEEFRANPCNTPTAKFTSICQ